MRVFLLLAVCMVSCKGGMIIAEETAPSVGVFNVTATNTFNTCEDELNEVINAKIIIKNVGIGYTLSIYEEEQNIKEVISASEDGRIFFGGRSGSYDGCFVNVAWKWDLAHVNDEILGYRVEIISIECGPKECKREWDIKATKD